MDNTPIAHPAPADAVAGAEDAGTFRIGDLVRSGLRVMSAEPIPARPPIEASI